VLVTEVASGDEGTWNCNPFLSSFNSNHQLQINFVKIKKKKVFGKIHFPTYPCCLAVSGSYTGTSEKKEE
jgi:hypothetical protein